MNTRILPHAVAQLSDHNRTVRPQRQVTAIPGGTTKPSARGKMSNGAKSPARPGQRTGNDTIATMITALDSTIRQYKDVTVAQSPAAEGVSA